ncbi:MAG: transporter permease [Bacteroidetes bacterium]|nr:transporter permease [Bacteroidota bacterium]
MQSGILAVAVREIKRIAVSKICIWGIIVVPILSAAILIYMMSAGLPQKIPIAVVDQDNTSTTRALVRQLDAFPKTDIKFKSLSFREARLRMERFEVYAILSIPKDFTRDAVSGQQPKLVYYTNNAFFASGNLLFQDLKTISVLASASVGLKTALAKGFSETQVMPVLQPITIDSHVVGNPWVNYSICLNTSLLPSILQLIILIFTVSAFGSEVKSRLGSELMRIGNNNIVSVIIGKMLPYTILYLLVSLVFMSVLFYYGDFPLKTGFFPMFLAYLCLILGSQGLGLILTAVFQNYRMGLSIASLLGMLSFSITGFSFPVEAMHSSLQALSYIFPMRHFFLIYVNQALDGFPIGYVAYHFVALLGFALLGLLVFPRIRSFLEFDYEE